MRRSSRPGCSGCRDYRMVYVPHPVQLLSREELRGYADRAFEEIVARLTPGRDEGRSRVPPP